MKVIDLLNKIANGEEVPKKVKWGEFELEWEELGYHDYKFLGTGNHLLFQGFATSVLNDEVEIIEEEKKIPKKLEYWQGLDKVRNDCELDDLEYAIKYGNYNFEMFFDKINEIIDYLQSKGE